MPPGRVLIHSIAIAAAAACAGLMARAAPDIAQEAKLVADDAADGDLLGGSVAVGVDTAVIGASAYAGSTQGAAYVFVRSAGAWTQQARLAGSDTATGDLFGSTVALDGDTAVATSLRQDGGRGAAYVFVRSAGAWTQQGKLVASDAAAGAGLGSSVALAGDTVVVGAADAANRQGAAYVFVRTGTTWSQQAKLTAADGSENDSFGFSVALSNDTALVGAYAKSGRRGAAYVFTRGGTTWSQQRELEASDPADGDAFGSSVALDGDTAAVGAFQKNGDRGAAYVFTRTGGVWTQETKLLAGDAQAGDYFGTSIAIEGDTLVAGVTQLGARPGAACIFTRSAGVWTQATSVVAGDASVNDESFGAAAAVHAGTAVVGASGKSASRGASYVFTGLPFKAAGGGPPLTSPKAPSIATPTVASATEIDVAWTDESTDESGFEIERSDDSGVNFTMIGTAAADVQRYSDTTLKPDRVAAYRVRAVNAAGASPYSGILSTTTAPTFDLVVKKGGTLVDSPKSLKDVFSISGKAIPNQFAPAAPFDPATDVVTISFGASVAPRSFTIPAGDPGWKTKRSTHTWKSPKGTTPVRAFVIDFIHGKFSFSQTKFGFTAAPVNPIEFVFHTDRDGAASRSAWVVKKTGLKSP